ncbi:MAG TPA: adenylate kinase [Clostridia bacterium]|nr:adenylate kinase [Clostridia bacterium]
MYLVMIGPPGAGKGTQAVRIAWQYGIAHVATGDIFRNAVKEKTPLGLKAKSYMESGQLVPDEIVIDMIAERLEEPDCRSGFVLDGFPRTLNQAQALDGVLAKLTLSLDRVILVDVPFEELVNRATGRRVCKDCGANYHIVYSPPSKPGVCDRCGGELYQRDDDKEETVRKRLQVYVSESQPLAAYYQDKGILSRIDGNRTIDEVTEAIVREIEALGLASRGKK